MVFVPIHTPWPTSKGLDHLYLHVYACLLLCFMLMIASLVLGFATLDAFSRFVVAWLRPTPIRPCLDVTIWDASPWCQLLCAYLSPFLLRAMICLPCLFVSLVGFLCIFTRLLTCSCIFNTMKLWTFDPNLHLSLVDTTFCSFSCLFVFLLVCLLSCFFACHAYHACSLYAFSYALCIFFFHCLSADFLSLPLHVHIWSEDVWS